MAGSSVGTKYYYEKGSVRVQVKISREDLVMLKSLAIDKDKSVVSLVADAVNWMLSNSDKIPADFPTPSVETKPFYTYINKESHKSLKKVSLGINKPLCDILGFILTVWARAGGEVG